MHSLITGLTDFVAQHPHLAAVVVFLLAASESIVVVGALVPGTAVLLAIAAMVGLGHLALWPILLAAVLGAVAGDGLSYWIGRRHRARIGAMWPFSRHPALMARGHAFLDRHGGKSIFIARFTPGMRAIVPVMAGSAGMAPGRFYAANIASAAVWAPAHILPGALAGMGLGAAGHMSLRLAGLALVVLIAVVLAIWGLRLVIGWLIPAIDRARARLAHRLRAGDAPWRRALLHVVAPRDDLRPVIGIGVPLAAMVTALVWLSHEVAEQAGLARADAAISHAITSLRSEPGDDVMIFLTAFGDWPVVTAATAAMVLVLIGRRDWHLGAGLAVIMALSSAVASALKYMMAIPRPSEIYQGVQSFSFPSGHATSAMTLFGLMAWFAWRGLPRGRARVLVALFAAIAAVIAVSRLYLAAHWPSDVLGGLMLGAALVMVFALAFRRSNPVPVAGIGLAVALTVFAGWGTAYALRTLPVAEARYARAQPAPITMTRAQWLAGGWRDLPTARTDLGGAAEAPITLQWAAPSADLTSTLAPQGWVPAVPLSLSTLPRYLTATAPGDLPVIARLNDGYRPVLTLIRPEGAGRAILTLWQGGATVDGTPILIGAVETEAVTHPMSFLTLSDGGEAGAPVTIPGAQVRGGVTLAP